MTKWDAYPMFGLLVKIDYISMYLAAFFTILGIILSMTKKDKYLKYINILSFIFTTSCITARTYASIDTTAYETYMISYIVVMILITVLSFIFMRKIKSIPVMVIMMIIELVLINGMFFTNQNLYPHKVDYSGEITADGSMICY